LSVDEDYSGSCDLFGRVAVDNVVGQWVIVTGNPNRDGAVDAFGHAALGERQVDRKWHAADHHIAEVAVGAGKAVGGEGEEGAHINSAGVGESKRVGRLDPSVAISTDEATCDRQNLRRSKGNVEGLWDCSPCAGENVEERLVAGLHSQNRSSSIEDYWIVENGGSSKVRADSDILNNTGSRSHGRDVGEDFIKVELTR